MSWFVQEPAGKFTVGILAFYISYICFSVVVFFHMFEEAGSMVGTYSVHCKNLHVNDPSFAATGLTWMFCSLFLAKGRLTLFVGNLVMGWGWVAERGLCCEEFTYCFGRQDRLVPGEGVLQADSLLVLCGWLQPVTSMLLAHGLQLWKSGSCSYSAHLCVFPV